MIVCKTCRVEKDENDFHRHRETATRRHPSCKECRKAERRASYGKNRDKQQAQMRAYYEKNGDTIRAQVRERSAEKRRDPEFVKRETEYNREWRRRNPDKMAAANARQRAQGRFTPDWTAEEWQQLLDLYGRSCLACGKTGVKLQPDHVIPLSWPGASNAIDNIQPLCGPCNRSKSDQHIDYRPTPQEAL
ncbi:HNH endonuclease signature motif containing protein [Streptomyces sp. NPDC057565]|uniref:HNH endonuclease signature motif containing protein n=1 Tax=Streptomyces sp. NPDC057565 TaxID=3346169 RepID=UPI0036B9B575